MSDEVAGLVQFTVAVSSFVLINLMLIYIMGISVTISMQHLQRFIEANVILANDPSHVQQKQHACQFFQAYVFCPLGKQTDN